MERPEQQLHVACADLLKVYEQRGLLAFTHPANGGFRTRTEAGIFRQLGVKAGVPDLLLWFPNGRTAQVELKAGRQPLSDPQLDWHVAMQRLGHSVYVARSVDELEGILRAERVPPVGKIDAKAAESVAGAFGAEKANLTNPHPLSSHSAAVKSEIP